MLEEAHKQRAFMDAKSGSFCKFDIKLKYFFKQAFYFL